MFSIGTEYTRDQIHQRLGGSKQTYLPTSGGAIVAACLRPNLNRDAPSVIVCGDGPRIAAAGDVLAKQENPIRVFVKLNVNRWVYRGRYKVKTSYTSGRTFDRHVNNSKREANHVSRVIVLKKSGRG